MNASSGKGGAKNRLTEAQNWELCAALEEYYPILDVNNVINLASGDRLPAECSAFTKEKILALLQGPAFAGLDNNERLLIGKVDSS